MLDKTEQKNICAKAANPPTRQKSSVYEPYLLLECRATSFGRMTN